MPFNLLLLPLSGGFILLSHWRLTLYFAKRLDKERLLLYSPLVGAILLGLSFGLSILIVSHPTWFGFRGVLALREWAYNTPPFRYSGIATLSLVLGAASPWFLNRFWPFCLLWTKEERGEKARFGNIVSRGHLSEIFSSCIPPDNAVVSSEVHGLTACS